MELIVNKSEEINHDKLRAFLLNLFKKIEYQGVKFPYLGQIYRKLFYERMINKEIKKADLKTRMKILHIGCGPLPLTAISLAGKNFKVTAVDYDPSAIKAARRYCQKYFSRDIVKFKMINGIKIDYSKYDAVWVSFTVYPKNKIIQKIITSSKPGTIIIFRKPGRLLQKIYGRTQLQDFHLTCDKYRIIKQFPGKESVIIKK